MLSLACDKTGKREHHDDVWNGHKRIANVGNEPDGIANAHSAQKADDNVEHLVRKLGYKVAFITGRESPMVQARANELHIDYLAMKCGRKLDALHTVCEKFNLSLDEAAYMGDDINDLPLIGKTGYFGAPANACRDVKEGADFVASRAGGEGAAREFMEFIVRGQGRWQEVLDFYLHA